MMVKRRKEVFWGLLLIFGALFILAGKMGFLQHVGIFKIVCTVFLAGILIENIVQKSFGGILFSLAFLGILYDKQLGIEPLTPVPILVAALLGTVGLNMVFHKKSHRKEMDVFWKDAKEVVHVEEEGQVQCAVHFGESAKYIDSPCLCRAVLESAFGSLNVYFDQAVLADGAAQADVNVMFGEMELYIPGDWKVIVDVEAVFGGVDESGRHRPSGVGSTLHISGKVTFGGLNIHYI